MKSKKIEESFDENWKNRLETDYNHWSIKPTNQIQLAFYNHWSVINEKIGSTSYVYVSPYATSVSIKR